MIGHDSEATQRLDNALRWRNSLDHVAQQLRDEAADGEPLPEEEWPNVPRAAIRLTTEWQYPKPESTGDEADEAGDVQVYFPVWVVTTSQRPACTDPVRQPLTAVPTAARPRNRPWHAVRSDVR